MILKNEETKLNEKFKQKDQVENNEEYLTIATSQIQNLIKSFYYINYVYHISIMFFFSFTFFLPYSLEDVEMICDSFSTLLTSLRK